jgi:hypothetical protein
VAVTWWEVSNEPEKGRPARPDYYPPVLCGKRIVVGTPAHNAEITTNRTADDLDRPIVDDMVLVDDAGADSTADPGRGSVAYPGASPRERAAARSAVGAGAC